MKEIRIDITGARIIEYSVTLEEDMPSVTATIGLFTSSGKQISKFSISTKNYYDQCFELPFEMIEPIKAIAEALETVLVREANKHLKILPEAAASVK